jgi:hypothetical protein
MMQDAPPPIKARAEEMLGRTLDRCRLVTDTTQFMEMEPGDVLEVAGKRYLLKGVEYEGRFGLDDEPKHWVKRALDWEDGTAKIIKLVFHEEFDLPIGTIKVRCFRSPDKESRILELVKDHPNFMHGLGLRDLVGNNVRVLDRVPGRAINQILDAMRLNHEDYFARHLRGLLLGLVEACEAIAFLHAHGERHGDIRRDHLFLDNQSGLLRWIDFDYNFDFRENPFGLDLFGLGNVLCYVVGRGIPTLHELKKNHDPALERLDTGDLSPVIPSRVFNLKKLFPYIPEALNRVLMHFSAAAPVFYESVPELLADLLPAITQLPGGQEPGLAQSPR